MQPDKSKEWTGGVGMVLEWYNEMMPSGHVAPLALRMGRKGAHSDRSHESLALPLPAKVNPSEWASGQGKRGASDDWFHSWGRPFQLRLGQT